MEQNRVAKTVQTAVYDELKRAIMTLRLEPGCEISTQEIATKLNVSRTPVREAFIRLGREDLVETLPQRGTIVSRINLKRVEQERFIRESLELAVLDTFLKKCTPMHIQKLKDYIEEQKRCYLNKDYAAFVHSDNRMHKLFFEVAGQNLAWETISNTTGHYNRIRVLTVQNEETGWGVLRQHDRIVKFMEIGESGQAKAELSSHVKKINYEKDELAQNNPSFFISGEESEYTIGRL